MIDKSIDIEARSRRNNLLFHNLAENRSEDCTSLVLEFLSNMLNIQNLDRSSIERAHRLGRYDRNKGIRPIIVAFSSYHLVETVMSNVSRLKDTRFSVNKDFPVEISRARRLLWPKVKQARLQYPGSKVSMGFPAKLQIDGRVVEDLFPEWEETIRGSRINMSHPSQQFMQRPPPSLVTVSESNQSSSLSSQSQQTPLQSNQPITQPITQPNVTQSATPPLISCTRSAPIQTATDLGNTHRIQSSSAEQQKEAPMELNDNDFPQPSQAGAGVVRPSRSKTRKAMAVKDTGPYARPASGGAVSSRSKSTSRVRGAREKSEMALKKSRRC